MAKKSPIAEREEKILEFWRKEKIFEKTLAKKAPNGEFVFYDGPPFATGEPHYGHILAGTIKDAIPRYKTMRGYHVPRRWGWDCHGLPIENLIEKELGLATRRDIEEYGIEKFNAAARANMLRYDAVWKDIVPRTGRFIDMDHAYLTMDWQYTESIWWSFKRLNDAGLVYRGFKPMHLCPHCETTLSNFEVGLNYKDLTDISVYVRFELVDQPGTSLLAWTTTPWTLPGNVAAAVNPAVTYVLVEVESKKGKEKVILAKDRLSIVKDAHRIEREFLGNELVGKKYKPLFSYYEKAELQHRENIFTVVAADFVKTDEGTGVVHIAPGFGEEDYNLSQTAHLPFIQHVSVDGRFKKEVTDFAGQLVKAKPTKEEPQAHQKADVEIIKYLAAHGTLFAKEKITHSYPHCWRCDTPLLNYATSSWFVAVTKIKDQKTGESRLVAENRKVHWVPTEIGQGRFGYWLENAKDWAVSRSRFWGAPLPVWKCEKCNALEFVGSIKELESKPNADTSAIMHDKKLQYDLHRPFIDKVTFGCEKCGATMKRIPEVFDTWYESGSMPYASVHFPFDSKTKEKPERFPADFIAEGQDQTRGWFYTLMVLGCSLFDQSPYKNVVVNGIVLAEDGQKMAKKLKNYPEVELVLDKYGADALRYYLLSSPVVQAEDLAFSEKGLDEVVKKVLNRLDNVYAFYALYADEKVKASAKSKNVLDQWIIARLHELGATVTEAMERYELVKATRPLADFIDDLSTWYIRRSRDRFKGDEAKDALATTRFVLEELAKLLAPFMPFAAEDLYQKVTEGKGEKSVHLEAWPEFTKPDKKLLDQMRLTRELVSLALEARASAGIKIRQPLAELTVAEKFVGVFNELVKDEVNVKKISKNAKQTESVKLDTKITPELKAEGIAREFIRSVQELRKTKGLKPNQDITLVIETSAEGKKILENHATEIKAVVRAKKIEFTPVAKAEKISIEGIAFAVGLEF